jgi:hypothetical protein
MSNNEKCYEALNEINDISNICAIFNAKVLSVPDIKKAYAENVSDEESSYFVGLLGEISEMLDGDIATDTTLLEVRVKNCRERSLKQIELTECFAVVVSRAIPVETLRVLVGNKDEREQLKQGLIAVKAQAPTLARLCS